MPKFCSCFKANSDDRKNRKQIKKDNSIKSNEKKNIDSNVFLLGKLFFLYIDKYICLIQKVMMNLARRKLLKNW